MNLGDLENDPKIREKLTNFHNTVNNIDKVLGIAFNENMSAVYDKLSTKEKVDFDLFTAYTLNTLYWLYLRTKGEDPNTNEVKRELTRVKEYMVKAKRAHERNTIRPIIDGPAAERIVRHGLQIYDSSEDRPNKKIKFDD